MKKKKTPTVVDRTKTGNAKSSKSRKNTTASTREAGRQRSGNNGPQQGSH